ncbi:FAD-dependent oxidoreductase [Aequorivita lipolytica]|uniref:Kynurenine 3-monooxygenase n=1 Tax=Aequorivita lipolytica TaxID=153267 RepID=A0A5C6YMZ1_9FLAO|nr:NAD(P)/FAD-dependent oxidoreductase [Aequorivita lipolytica]TXD68634.1 FAD-dependent monooxygenase [Aequorivita lipolytica]SRX53227.1 Kynurenine 3-monooxygenase [Aequorivita lipolytica]
MNNILIIGAGLCGSLLALRMAQRGYQVTLVEKRPDLRKTTQDAGRSINLALSDRGLRGLRLAGVEEEAKKLCIPMNGRMIHDKAGNTFLSPYSGRNDEYINSISRPGLNMLLLDEAEKMTNVKIIFNQACEEVDLENASATFRDFNSKEETKITADVILATDGAGSVVRKNMFESRKFLFSFSQQWLSHGYKELEIPALPTAEKTSKNDGYRTYKNSLHIWPRGEDMLIALPNLDGSFTVTLFLPYENSDYCFANLTTPEMVNEYFNKEFPDVVEMIPNLSEEFFNNPTGPLGTVKCSPWNSFGKVLLLGDAAHAIVPFYGQGMNASFEDVVVFDEVLEKFNSDEKISWNTIFKEYEAVRKKDTDAIADLAVDNFHEMKEHTAMEIFQRKRKLETAFEAEFPQDYYSKYSLVTFKESITYSEAMKRGRAQDKAILNLLDDGKITEEMSLKEKLELVKKETETILHNDEVAFG